MCLQIFTNMEGDFLISKSGEDIVQYEKDKSVLTKNILIL